MLHSLIIQRFSVTSLDSVVFFIPLSTLLSVLSKEALIVVVVGVDHLVKVCTHNAPNFFAWRKSPMEYTIVMHLTHSDLSLQSFETQRLRFNRSGVGELARQTSAFE